MNEQIINYSVSFLFLLAAIIGFAFNKIKKVTKSDKKIYIVSSIFCLIMSFYIFFITYTTKVQ